MVLELAQLHEATRVSSPYIIVAHSHGGIIAREFVALLPVRIEIYKSGLR